MSGYTFTVVAFYMLFTICHADHNITTIKVTDVNVTIELPIAVTEGPIQLSVAIMETNGAHHKTEIPLSLYKSYGTIFLINTNVTNYKIFFERVYAYDCGLYAVLINHRHRRINVPRMLFQIKCEGDLDYNATTAGAWWIEPTPSTPRYWKPVPQKLPKPTYETIVINREKTMVKLITRDYVIFALFAMTAILTLVAIFEYGCSLYRFIQEIRSSHPSTRYLESIRCINAICCGLIEITPSIGYVQLTKEIPDV